MILLNKKRPLGGHGQRRRLKNIQYLKTLFLRGAQILLQLDPGLLADNPVTLKAVGLLELGNGNLGLAAYFTVDGTGVKAGFLKGLLDILGNSIDFNNLLAIFW